MSTYKNYQEGLIKTLLTMPDELINVLDIVDSDDFEDVNYQLVFQAAVNLYSRKDALSIPNIILEIANLGGGVDPAWIMNLEVDTVEWITKATPVSWAKLVKQESIKYKLAQKLKNSVLSLETDGALDVIEDLRNELTKISLSTGPRHRTPSEIVNTFIRETNEIEENGGLASGIPSYYPSLDSYTGGWKPSQLITVAARTSVGKTVFAMNCALAALMANKSVLFFSLEMSEREFMARMLASIAMISIKNIEEAKPMSDEETKRLQEALNLIGTSKLQFDDETNVTIEYIRARALKQAQSEDGLDMIIVDYLQLLTIRKSFRGSRQEAVAEISRSMKLLANEFKVPVMVVAQIKRKDKSLTDDEQIPTLDDIRESGAIANDSNIVLLIHRNTAKQQEEIDPKALFILAKNRQGAADKYISIRCALEYNLFIDESKTGANYLKSLERESLKEHEYNSLNPNVEIPDNFNDTPVYFNDDTPDIYFDETEDDIDDFFGEDDE